MSSSPSGPEPADPGPVELSRRAFLKSVGVAAITLPAFACARPEVPQTKQEEFHMEIKRAGSQPSGKGPAEWFTGTVRIDPLFSVHDPARAAGASVTFEPGARTAWHTHPLGQTLIVTAGVRAGAARGRPGRGDPAGRRGVVPAGREALARGRADHGHDAHRHPGSSSTARWSSGWSTSPTSSTASDTAVERGYRQHDRSRTNVPRPP